MTIQMHTAMNQVQPLNGDLHTGHMTSSCMTSSQVTKTFTWITFHRIEIEPWARCHCVCLVKTHRMICNMTYLGHLSGQVIWPDLRSNFQIDLSGSKCTCFDASWREEYDGVSRFSLSFLVQKLFAKNLIFPKSNFFCLTCPGKVKMWPKVVKSGLVRFKTSLFFCLLLLQGSISIKGQTSRGVATPTLRCSLGWWNRRCGRGLMNFDCIGPLKDKKCSWNPGDQSGALTISVFLHFMALLFRYFTQETPAPVYVVMWPVWR